MYLALKYWAHYCYICDYRWDCHFTRSSKPCESPAVYRVKAVPKFLSCVKDGPLEKLLGGGGGEFSSCRNFFS